VSNARAAQHLLNHLHQSFRPRRGTGHLRRAVPACYQHPLPTLARATTLLPCVHLGYRVFSESGPVVVWFVMTLTVFATVDWLQFWQFAK
jgi:hypothetical protein